MKKKLQELQEKKCKSFIMLSTGSIVEGIISSVQEDIIVVKVRAMYGFYNDNDNDVLISLNEVSIPIMQIALVGEIERKSATC